MDARRMQGLLTIAVAWLLTWPGPAAAQIPGPSREFASLVTEALTANEGDAAPCKVKKVEILTKPTVKVGGRIVADHMLCDQDDLHEASFGDAANRTRFESVRINVSGDVYENVDYKLEIAFGEQGPNTDRPTAKDVFLTLKELAWLQNVRIGHFKEPFSLDQLHSGLYLTFMERSLLDAFAPARNMGIMEFGHFREDQTLSWYSGIFRSETDDDAVDESEDSADFSSTTRMVWNPWYDEPSEGRYVAHLGCAYSFREYGDDTVTYNKDHELNLIFPLGNPVAINALGGPVVLTSNLHLFGLEALVINGPLHAEAEWVHVRLNGLNGSDGDFNSAYVQVGYFLTGEHKGYRKDFHTFDRTKIHEPFFCVRTCDGVRKGMGAWELKARWSYIDAEDNGINGGQLEDFSTGVNWYLNNYTRLMLDYIYGTVHSRPTTGLEAGNVSQVGVRAQVDF
jgi:phosphate-selective porin OprO/OprP